jgi:hypothetical protein
MMMLFLTCHNLHRPNNYYTDTKNIDICEFGIRD